MYYYLSPVIKQVIDNGNLYRPNVVVGSSFIGIRTNDTFLIATNTEQPELTKIMDLENECINRGIDYSSVLQWQIGG